jgi:hypothetical protein
MVWWLPLVGSYSRFINTDQSRWLYFSQADLLSR